MSGLGSATPSGALWSGGTAGTLSSQFMAVGTAASANSPRRLALSRPLVLPGRKNGGTVLIFELRRPMVLQLTVVKVFPTCKVMGSVLVRGRAGINRIPFRGRVHGRRLSYGTYRLLIGGRRAQPTAVTTIVVARGKVSGAKLRKARRANACVPTIGFNWAAPDPYSNVTGTGTGGGDDKGISDPVVSVAKGVVKKGKSLAGGAKDAIQDAAPTTRAFLVLVGLLTLTTATFGALLVINVMRWRERLFR
jgi:hypothetical protein